jgi:hypothetical protein
MAERPVSLALSKKEAKEASTAMSVPGNASRYPWGTRVELDTRSLEKLGLKELPKVGSYVTVTAYCCVTSVSESQQVDGDENRSVSLQIEEMSLAGAKPKSGKAVGKGYKKKEG